MCNAKEDHMCTLHLIKKRTKLPVSSCRTGNNKINNFGCGCYQTSKILIGNLRTKAFLVNYEVKLHDWMANFFFNKCNKTTVSPTMAAATFVVTANIFLISICLFSKRLINFSSMSAPFVEPYIGLRQHNSFCTMSSEEYREMIAKRGIPLISTLSSRATLKVLTDCNATAYCIFTSAAMSSIHRSTVRADTGRILNLEKKTFLLGKPSKRTSEQLINTSLMKSPSVKGFPRLAIHSATL